MFRALVRILSLFLVISLGFVRPVSAGPSNAPGLTGIAVDYPAPNSIFPPDFASPTLLWRDSSGASAWRIQITFSKSSAVVQLESPGDRPAIGEIDETCVKAGAEMPKATPLEAEQHSWKPDPNTWERIKKDSVKGPATITITGFRREQPGEALSQGHASIRTSKDPVGAPIFYRDVPLISVPVGERGVIMPLPTDAIPLIAWRLRYVTETRNRTMMQGLPTCVNCHSFSRDGSTLGLDVDGPGNDKGLYGIVRVQKETSIRDQDVIRWSSFAEEKATKRFGFMSQVSPDGKYVVTSIENPGSHMKGLDNRLYNGFYTFYGFGQVFYPTKGVLAWYSKETGKLQTLPGADDPNYVQTSAFWSPDGKYLVFSRAPAKEPYHDGQPVATYANDPNETQIQYDLYRIPFNNGHGGTAERVLGASENGMSNNFPKVSPDGNWIVFVQNKNGLLMRPDSQLYIVPFKGGQARKLNANTARMNSWHSFSPNGRWLVFSSKGRSLYTGMYLTHIDSDGNDSPAIVIENATAANRAVNIPEFVNIGLDQLLKIEAPAVEFYRLKDHAASLAREGKFQDALAELEKALQLDPEDASAHHGLAVALQSVGRTQEAVQHYRKSLEIKPKNASAHNNLGVIAMADDRLDEGIEEFNQAVAINPNDAEAHSNLGTALMRKGRTEEAVEHFQACLQINPDHAEALNNVGIALVRRGQLNDGIPLLEKAVSLKPESLEYQYNLGRVLAARHSFTEALPHFQKAAELSGGRDFASLEMLAAMYGELQQYQQAAATARRALDLASEQNNHEQADVMRERIQQYEALAARPSSK